MPKNNSADLDYIRKLYAPQDALLQSIDEALHDINQPIHVGAEEGKLLQMLIKLHGAKTIVEIGTLAGYSTIWMARALPEDGHIYTINKDAEHIALASKFFAESDVKNRITMLEGDAHKMLPELSSKAPFDMVFIDADKISYDAYLDWSEKNIRKGGLIVGDNTLLFGAAAQDSPPDDVAPGTWNAMRHFNQRLANPDKYFTIMIPTLEGLSVAIKLF